MKQNSAPPEIGLPIKGHFVQTDRATHEAWAQFSVRRPSASGVLHLLVANVGAHNAVVIGHKTIAKALGISDRTVRTAIAELEAGNWLQVVKLGAGREAAYVINDRVAWAQARDNLRASRFTAEVIADFEDQREGIAGTGPLHRLPHSGETQIPAGSGLPPPSQPFLGGMEPALPATRQDETECVAQHHETGSRMKSDAP